MNEAAGMFKDMLEEREIKSTYVSEDESVIRVGFDLDGTSLALFFSFDEECEHVSIWGVDFCKVPGGKEDTIYRACNILNAKYRWARFYLDTKNTEVRIEGDAIIRVDTAADVCYEYMVRFCRITEEAYKILMRELWS